MAMQSVVKSASPPPYSPGERQAEQTRGRPWRAPCRRGRSGRGPTPRRTGGSRARRTPARRAEHLLLGRELDRHAGDRRRRPPPTAFWGRKCGAGAHIRPQKPQEGRVGGGVYRSRVAVPERGEAFAVVGGRLLTGLADVTADPAALEGAGTWAVVLTAEGEGTFARFDRCTPLDPGAVAGELRSRAAGPWPGVALDQWTSSLDRDGFERAVTAIRDSIAAGDVYQVNLTRRLTAALPGAADPVALAARLAVEHPAPFAATVALPERDLWVVSASPERFLGRRGRTGALVAHQGHRGRGRRLPAEGPGRERDDRRPRAQRPRSGLRLRLDHGARAAGHRGPPRARPPRQHGRGAARRRSHAGPTCSRPPSRPAR